MCFPAHRLKPRPKITLTHNKTKEHIDGRIHMCELYLSSVCCFGLLNHASATRFFYLYIFACCFGLLNHASSTRFFYLYICASYDASIVLMSFALTTSKLTEIPKLSIKGRGGESWLKIALSDSYIFENILSDNSDFQ